MRWIHKAPELAPLRRDFEAPDLAEQLTEHAIDRTILVQAAPSLAETEHLLSIARETAFVAGVVGWINFEDIDALTHLERLAADPYFCGVRPMLQDIHDTDWILDPAHEAILQRLVDLGLCFDALVQPRHLEVVRTLATRYPNLTIVIDHAAKPRIAEAAFEDWQSAMTKLSQCPRITCKLSGLATEATSDWRIEDLRPYVAHLLTVFGSDHLLWGSDWPLVKLAGGYDAWWQATQALLAPLSEPEREAVLGITAARVYGLNDREAQ